MEFIKVRYLLYYEKCHRNFSSSHIYEINYAERKGKESTQVLSPHSTYSIFISTSSATNIYQIQIIENAVAQSLYARDERKRSH